MSKEDSGINLVLIPAAGEEPTSPEYQRELVDMSHSLARANVRYSASMRVQESIDGGSLLDGRFWIELLQLTIATGAAQGLLAAVVQTWLSKRLGRRFSVERNGVTKQCRTLDEALEFLAEVERRAKDASGPKVTIHDR